MHTCRFASALSLLGTENDNQVRAIGVTVLPDGLFGKVLQVIFTPPEAKIKLAVGGDGDGMRISAACVGANMVSFEPASLTLHELASINNVRKIVSNTISGKQSLHNAAKMRPIVQDLMQVSAP